MGVSDGTTKLYVRYRRRIRRVGGSACGVRRAGSAKPRVCTRRLLRPCRRRRGRGSARRRTCGLYRHHRCRGRESAAPRNLAPAVVGRPRPWSSLPGDEFQRGVERTTLVSRRLAPVLHVVPRRRPEPDLVRAGARARGGGLPHRRSRRAAGLVPGREFDCLRKGSRTGAGRVRRHRGGGPRGLDCAGRRFQHPGRRPLRRPRCDLDPVQARWPARVPATLPDAREASAHGGRRAGRRTQAGDGCLVRRGRPCVVRGRARGLLYR